MSPSSLRGARSAGAALVFVALAWIFTAPPAAAQIEPCSLAPEDRAAMTADEREKLDGVCGLTSPEAKREAAEPLAKILAIERDRRKSALGGGPRLFDATPGRKESIELATSEPFVDPTHELPQVARADDDKDGLEDRFERRLADLFTPAYHTSIFEDSGTGFALFADDPNGQYVTQVFDEDQPVSYYRVKPLGIADGVGSLQIDYLTLWNRDDGQRFSLLCRLDATEILGLAGFGLAQIFDGVIQHHDIDNERSSILVTAPAVDGAYNTDQHAYHADFLFTAAHEDTISDRSNEVPLDIDGSDERTHVVLYLSRSKHGTYHFNPDLFTVPLAPDLVISLCYDAIDGLYFAGAISYDTWQNLRFVAQTVFYECFIENYDEGVYDGPAHFAQTRINVGELGHPINGSRFIRVPELGEQKLCKQWRVPNPVGSGYIPTCTGVPCGESDGCGHVCPRGSGCDFCKKKCKKQPPGAPDGCGGFCSADVCHPSCEGVACGTDDGCEGTCEIGSGCFCVGCAGPPPMLVDLKIQGADGPLSLPAGTAATVAWTSTNATSCSVAAGASVLWTGLNGSGTTAPLTGSQTFTLLCLGAAGTASDTVLVQVAPANLCVRANPTLTLSPATQTGYGAQQLIYQVTITNRDAAPCGASTFRVDPALPGSGWVHTPTWMTFTLSPGESASRSVVVSSPSTAPAGPYRWREVASNLSTPGSSGSAEATHVVQSITPPSTCGAAAPRLEIAPASQAGWATANLGYAIQVTNQDGPACPVTTFRVDPTLPGQGWVHTPTWLTFTLAPGQTGSRTALVTSPFGAAPGPYAFGETASNTNEPSLSASTSALYLVQDARPEPGCAAAAPLVTIAPDAQTGFQAQQLTYSVTVTNQDDPSCPATTFRVDSTLPGAGWVHVPTWMTFTLLPGESGRRDVIITSASTAPFGLYPIPETASRPYIQGPSGSGQLTFQVVPYF